VQRGACIFISAGVNLGLELGADKLENNGEDYEGTIDDANKDAIEAGEEGNGGIDWGCRAGCITGGARAVANLGVVAEAAISRNWSVTRVGIDIESIITSGKVETDH
jgi:hypothetical protein